MGARGFRPHGHSAPLVCGDALLPAEEVGGGEHEERSEDVAQQEVEPEQRDVEAAEPNAYPERAQRSVCLQGDPR